MSLERGIPSVVDGVVVYDGRLLLVERPDGWGLPAGAPEPAETAEATAARLVYELTGYLVDGSTSLPPDGERADTRQAVVCQLLSETPSAEATLTPRQIRWIPLAEAAGAGLPEAVHTYLEGHTPV